MKTVVRIGMRVESATLQLRLYGVLVPIVDRVGDVIDERRRAALRSVTRNHKRIGIAENEEALRPCISDHLHSEQVRVEIASLGVIVDLIGNVVDRDSR